MAFARFEQTDLDGVEDKLLAAVLARLRALGTLGQAVLRQQPTHHPRPAFVLAVDALLGTHALVILNTHTHRGTEGETA